MVKREIDRELYYHGLLPREDTRSMLHKKGEFLVRTTELKAGQPRAFVLSVMFDENREEGAIKHYIIQEKGSKYRIDKKKLFDSIPEMIDHHIQHHESLNQEIEVYLKVPIIRQNWQLSHDDIVVTKKLGEGAFGEVSLGTLRKGGKLIPVAIKITKLETLNKEQIKEIMGEVRIMRRLNHPNVVKLYGVAAGREPLMIVMELCENGSLNDYLQKKFTTVSVKSEMCMGAAWGLEYLHSNNFIHCDIAARNCLYGDGKVKISDFGLTFEGSVYEMDSSKRVPIRWIAPETLRTYMYSQKTDCFAFGILCWEIFSNGKEPYPGLTVAEVNRKVKEGYRMEMPPECPVEISNLIIKHCWTESTNTRWSMKQIVKSLELITHSKQTGSFFKKKF